MAFLVSLEKEICILTKDVLVLCIDFFFSLKVLNSYQKLAEVSHASTVKSRIQDVVVPVTLDRNSWQCFALDLFVSS